jgi:hypothetical protein
MKCYRIFRRAGHRFARNATEHGTGQAGAIAIMTWAVSKNS